MNTKVRHQKTRWAILIGTDGQANFLITQRARSDECFDRRFPDAGFVLDRISQIQDPGFRQNDTIRGHFSPRFEDRRIAFAERAEARENFFDGVVLAFQRAQSYLCQIPRSEIRRADQRQWIVQKFFSLQLAAGQRLKQMIAGLRHARGRRLR